MNPLILGCTATKLWHVRRGSSRFQLKDPGGAHNTQGTDLGQLNCGASQSAALLGQTANSGPVDYDYIAERAG